MDNNIESIVKIRTALYNAIQFKRIDEESYDLITSGIKIGGSHAWELSITILEKMSSHFSEFKLIIIKMLNDPSGYVRETALLVIEGGGFTKDEKKEFYTHMLNDKNKKVRYRAIDMIFREGKKFKLDIIHILEDRLRTETDNEIKLSLEAMLKNK